MPCVFILRKKSTSSFAGCKKTPRSGVFHTTLLQTIRRTRRLLRGVPLLGSLLGVYAHLVTGSVLVLELHDSVDQRVDSEISTESDVAAGVPLGSALANDDVAGDD